MILNKNYNSIMMSRASNVGFNANFKQRTTIAFAPAAGKIKISETPQIPLGTEETRYVQEQIQNSIKAASECDKIPNYSAYPVGIYGGNTSINFELPTEVIRGSQAIVRSIHPNDELGVPDTTRGDVNLSVVRVYPTPNQKGALITEDQYIFDVNPDSGQVKQESMPVQPTGGDIIDAVVTDTYDTPQVDLNDSNINHVEISQVPQYNLGTKKSGLSAELARLYREKQEEERQTVLKQLGVLPEIDPFTNAMDEPVIATLDVQAGLPDDIDGFAGRLKNAKVVEKVDSQGTEGRVPKVVDNNLDSSLNLYWHKCRPKKG